MGEASEVIIPLFGVLDVTGEVLLMWVICFVLILISALVTRRLKERPGKLQNLLEAGVEYLDNFLPVLLASERRESIFTFSAHCSFLSFLPTIRA